MSYLQRIHDHEVECLSELEALRAKPPAAAQRLAKRRKVAIRPPRNAAIARGGGD